MPRPVRWRFGSAAVANAVARLGTWPHGGGAAGLLSVSSITVWWLWGHVWWLSGRVQVVWAMLHDLTSS